MVQRFPEEGNWSGFHFSHPSKLGDMLVQLKSGGEIKVPVSLQQRRLLDSETEDSQHHAPGAKRSKLMDMPDVSSFRSSSSTAWTGGDNIPFEARPRNRLPVTTAHCNLLDEPSPLGLTLKKTPSFLDLVSMTIAQGHGNNEQPVENSSQGTASRAGIPSACPTQGKIKASNFGASSLRIGSWERVSRYEGDVVAKCYYAKRKLVWEVLESGLKSKIELQWSDISSIKASYGEGQFGVLEVEVSRPPLFFKETNPQPRKHTLWEATSDFTGGEATVCKRHVLRFPEGVLNKHYEKLLQCDARLKALAGPSTVEVKREDVVVTGAQPVEASSNNGLVPPKVKVEVTDKGRSPSSVMESRGSDDSDAEETTGAPTNAELSTDEVDQKPSRGMTTLVLAGSDNELVLINELYQILMEGNNTQETGGGAGVGGGMIRVSSMTGLFEDGTSFSSYSWNDPSALEPRNNILINESDNNNDNNNNNNNLNSNNSFGSLFELDSSGEHPTSLQESVRQCFTRHGSSGDLLVNLPRIASLPQLFENGLIRRDSQLSLLEFS